MVQAQPDAAFWKKIVGLTQQAIQARDWRVQKLRNDEAAWRNFVLWAYLVNRSVKSR